MNDSEERKSLTDRIGLLNEALTKGKIKFATHLVDGFKESHKKIRYSEDGLVIPESVDPRIRTLTLGLSYQKYRKDLKAEASILDIQKTYFDFVESSFGDVFKQMKKKNATPYQVARYFSDMAHFVNDFTKDLPDFMEIAQEFWQSCGEALCIHLEDSLKVKAVFGGDMFPSGHRNIASTCGLYVDTIVLPCPFMRSRHFMKMWSPKQRTLHILEFGLNLLTYKDLATLVEPPIVVVLPEISIFEERDSEYLSALAEKDAVKHVSSLFGLDFRSLEECFKFANDLDSPNELIKATVKPHKLLFDTEWKGTTKEKVERFMNEQKFMTEKISGGKVGIAVVSHTYGRMAQANDLMNRSRRLRATPLINVETSWKYFNWKLAYNSEKSSEQEALDLHVMRGLSYGAKTELRWLGNIPPQDLLRIRQSEDAEEIRAVFTRGLKDLLELTPDDFLQSSLLVIDNINNAFEEHQQKLEQLRRKKLKFYGVDVASCLAVGSISIAAAFLNPAFAALAAALGWLGLNPSPKEIKANFDNLREEEKNTTQSATGLFFKHATE